MGSQRRYAPVCLVLYHLFGIQEEMMQWKHHKNKLPKMRDIQDFTGRIPLLLRPLFEFGQQDFCAVENVFRAASEIVAVGLNVKEFADERIQQAGRAAVQRVRLSSNWSFKQ